MDALSAPARFLEFALTGDHETGWHFVREVIHAVVSLKEVHRLLVRVLVVLADDLLDQSVIELSVPSKQLGPQHAELLSVTHADFRLLAALLPNLVKRLVVLNALQREVAPGGPTFMFPLFFCVLFLRALIRLFYSAK